MKPQPDNETGAALRDTAARWTIRRDRGLSAAEAIEFELWLAADPRHGAAMQRAGKAWALLDRVPEPAAQDVHAEAARRRTLRRRLAWSVSLAAAALALAAIGLSRRPAAPLVPAAALAATGPRVVTLADGTLVRVNAGGEIVEQFTASERRVELSRGEAHFTVTQDAARPFVVVAGTLRVRAIGTAFNVNFQPAQAVEVLVTEGVVQLNHPGEASAAPATVARDPVPLLRPGQRALVALAPASPAAAVVITTASDDEIAHTLAWQAPLLRLGGATLAELVLEFQRSSGQRVILADPALASLRVGGRFRADDLAGFAHLLATSLDLETDRAADGTLVLRKKRPQTR